MMIAYESVINVNKTAFIKKVKEVSEFLEIHPSWLMIVIKLESGFNRKAENKVSGAVGLLQWIPRFVAPILNVPSSRVGYVIKRMSGVQQLELIRKFLSKYKGKMTDPYQTYLAVFWPAALGKSEDYVIGQRGSLGIKGQSYKWNYYLDQKFGNNDGKITIIDIKGFVDKSIPAGVPLKYTNVKPSFKGHCFCCKRPF